MRECADVVKRCQRCAEEKPIEDFAVDRKRPGGRYYICKSCKRADDRRRREDPEKGAAMRKRNREWHKTNPERSRAISRRKWMKARYGITVERYDEMLAAQGGKCAICGSPDGRGGHPGYGLTFCVDHDHETQALRGLLCHPCNRGLGQFRDDPDLLRAALAYLEG